MSEELLKTIGTILKTPHDRDAIHVAIVQVQSAMYLNPGQRVQLNADGRAISVITKEFIGVVDPFLDTAVAPEEEFWLFLKPGSIKSLRHMWTHPSITDPIIADRTSTIQSRQAQRSESEDWMNDFASEVNMSYSDLIDEAKRVVDEIRRGDAYAESYTLNFDTPERCWTDGKTFWKHFHRITGIEVPDTLAEDDNLFFSCAC